MSLSRALVPLFALVLLSEPLDAAPSRRVGFPCKGCLFQPPPEGATKSPLLVVLHGDAPGGKAPLVERDVTPWLAPAKERGVAVFAPMCPKAEGCRVGSYWQWSEGDPPAWIEAQVDVIAKEYAIDPDRVWVAGWSGGASFLGWHYARLGARYGAVVFAGGGLPKSASGCPRCAPPAYFLVGDRNPLHHLAKGLWKDVSGCTSDVTWDLQPGKDHAGEWRALGAPGKPGALLDWLAKHPRACKEAGAEAEAAAEAAAEAGAEADAGAEAEAGAEADADAAAVSDAGAAPVVLPPGSPCGCRFVGAGGGSAGAFVSFTLLAALRNLRACVKNRTGKAPKKA